MIQMDRFPSFLVLLTILTVVFRFPLALGPVHSKNYRTVWSRPPYWLNRDGQSNSIPELQTRLQTADFRGHVQTQAHERPRGHWTEKRLVKDLLHDYEKNSRPVVDGLTPIVWLTPTQHTQQITVEFGLELLQVLDLDEMDQVVTVSVRTLHKWKDYNLIWDPSEYDGISSVTIPSNYLWLPDIALYNYADERLSERRPCDVRIYSDGTIFWGPMAIFKSMCSVEIRNFPFDRQLCHLKFGPWAHDGFRVNITFYAGEENLRMTNYVLNQEWSVTRTRAVFTEISYPCCPEKYPDISFYIEMRRQSAFYTYILILPSVLLSVLTAVVFWLPPETPSKIILAMNVFVAFLLLHLLLEDTTPASASSFPLLGAYYCFNMGVITMSMYLCCITVNLHFRVNDSSEPSPWLKRICRLIGPKLLVNVSTLTVKQTEEREDNRVWNWKPRGPDGKMNNNNTAQHSSRSPAGCSNLFTPVSVAEVCQPVFRTPLNSNMPPDYGESNLVTAGSCQATINMPLLYPSRSPDLHQTENSCLLCTQKIGFVMDSGPELPCFCQPIPSGGQSGPETSFLFPDCHSTIQSVCLLPTLTPADQRLTTRTNSFYPNDDDESSFGNTFKKLLHTMNRMQHDVRYITNAVRQLEHKQSLKSIQLEQLEHWRTICLVLDRVFFILYTITILLSYFLFHPSLVNFDQFDTEDT
uniref:Acetylcholine-gated chloride channel subunit-2 n=1 Tax=Cryptocotyle lingua TaxID=66766 RepID=A0A7U0YEK0_9TREM|nr:acetylcholine-gated chloride channel subunit-2 [Cryptocotyle lingua]